MPPFIVREDLVSRYSGDKVKNITPGTHPWFRIVETGKLLVWVNNVDEENIIELEASYPWNQNIQIALSLQYNGTFTSQLSYPKFTWLRWKFIGVRTDVTVAISVVPS